MGRDVAGYVAYALGCRNFRGLDLSGSLPICRSWFLNIFLDSCLFWLLLLLTELEIGLALILVIFRLVLFGILLYFFFSLRIPHFVEYPVNLHEGCPFVGVGFEYHGQHFDKILAVSPLLASLALPGSLQVLSTDECLDMLF